AMLHGSAAETPDGRFHTSVEPGGAGTCALGGQDLAGKTWGREQTKPHLGLQAGAPPHGPTYGASAGKRQTKRPLLPEANGGLRHVLLRLSESAARRGA